MDTCVGCRIVEYLFIAYWLSVCDLGPIHGCMLSTIININRPNGAMYSQKVYVTQRVHGFFDCWKLTFYVVNI